MTLRELILALKGAGIDDAETEARLLFCHFSGLSPWQTVGADPECDAPALADALSRRLKREPLPYILGEAAFYRESYYVTPATLIPRSDTELLVEEAIRRLPRGAHFADLCTGSGCIAISVLANRPDCTAIALDLSADALDVAKRNAARNGVADRLDFLCADVLCDLPLAGVDAILSNPPYIAAAVIDTLSPEVLAEPRLALDGGEDGLLFYRSLIPRAASCIAPQGVLLFEIGYDQADAVSAIAREAGLCCEVRSDLGGRPRLAVMERAE